jgi:hypothetical protein
VGVWEPPSCTVLKPAQRSAEPLTPDPEVKRHQTPRTAAAAVSRVMTTRTSSHAMSSNTCV